MSAHNPPHPVGTHRPAGAFLMTPLSFKDPFVLRMFWTKSWNLLSPLDPASALLLTVSDLPKSTYILDSGTDIIQNTPISCVSHAAAPDSSSWGAEVEDARLNCAQQISNSLESHLRPPETFPQTRQDLARQGLDEQTDWRPTPTRHPAPLESG